MRKFIAMLGAMLFGHKPNAVIPPELLKEFEHKGENFGKPRGRWRRTTIGAFGNPRPVIHAGTYFDRHGVERDNFIIASRSLKGLGRLKPPA